MESRVAFVSEGPFIDEMAGVLTGDFITPEKTVLVNVYPLPTILGRLAVSRWIGEITLKSEDSSVFDGLASAVKEGTMPEFQGE